MKKNKQLISQLKKAGASKAEARELFAFARGIEDTSHFKILSHRKKNKILRKVIGKYYYMPRLAISGAAAVAMFAILLSPIVMNSLPGNPLYDVKIATEKVRSSIQPGKGYEESLIIKRDDEINKLKTQGASEDKIQRAEDEKTEIVNSIPQSQNTNSTSGNTSTSSSDDDHDGGDDNAARDECRQKLDYQKSIGINVSSDQYKACDNLRNSN